MADDQVPPVRSFVLFFVAMLGAIAVGAVIGVAIFGAPGLPGASAERRIPTEEPDEIVEVSLREFSIGAVPVSIPRGGVVEFVVVNNGSVQHDFRVNGNEGVSRLDPGSERAFRFGPVEGDSLTAWCTILGHREAGMEITFQVTEQPTPAGEAGG